ncbi:MAG TPA: AI-2E family transporter [Gemmataceae bacterium]|nr:AI-2E family transporter [Gemmataceae bacterium]
MAPGSASSWQRAVIVLTGGVLSVLVITCLYWAQAIFIPVAMAIFLTFLLSPPVTALQRRGLGRTPAVVVVVLTTALVLGGVGWLVTSQVSNLVGSLPQYSDVIRRKANQIRDWASSGVIGEVQHLTQKVAEEVKQDAKDKNQAKTDERPSERSTATSTEASRPEPVRGVVLEPATSSLWSLPETIRPFAEGLGQTGLVAVLAIFMLIKREDLRNRLIRLVGHGRITTTTKAVDDAGRRISRFLVVQLVINSIWGTLFALGLLALGVPYAALWGFLAALLRYIPYVGIWFAMLMPVMLAVAISDGWGQPLGVLGLVAGLEVVSYNFVEPLLFGQAIGVSEVALLIAAAFWAWLWGPVGLVLSGPLTVCLVVAGEYVPWLHFIAVALGDAPALEPRVAFYQRLLAHDQDEATDVVESYANDHPPEAVYDDLLVNSLNLLKRDRWDDELTAEDERFILATVVEAADHVAASHAWPEDNSPSDRRGKLLSCPAEDAADEAALQLLAGALDERHWQVDIAPANLLAAELTTRIEQAEPDVLCIVALPPGGLAHARYLCKRLRMRFPDLKIVVGRWGLLADSVESNRRALTAAGADEVTTSLAETRRWLLEWRPVFQADQVPAAV